MTIQDLASSVGGGFHDAVLKSFSVDLVERWACFDIELCVGDPSSDDIEIRERYRSAVLRLKEVQYLFMDPPDPRYPATGPWLIDLCEPDLDVTSQIPTADHGFAARFFSSTTNAFLHFAAMDASIAYPEASLEEPRFILR